MTEISGFESVCAADREGAANSVSETYLPMETLRPLMEGARARGVADACELLGVGAVLLDRAGGVLHLTSSARVVLDGALRLVEGHLVAAHAETNQIMQRIVAAALAGSSREDVIAAEGAPSVRVRAVPLPGARDDEAQLLKAVLFVSDVRGVAANDCAKAEETACAA